MRANHLIPICSLILASVVAGCSGSRPVVSEKDSGGVPAGMSADVKKILLEEGRKSASKLVQEATEALGKCLGALSDDAKQPGKAGYDKCVKDFNDACDAADLGLQLNEERYK